MMGTTLIWKQSQFNHSETRHNVNDLADLQDLVRSEFRDRMVYIEARENDGSGEPLDSRLRVSPDDLTDEDFLWLTANVQNQARGVRA